MIGLCLFYTYPRQCQLCMDLQFLFDGESHRQLKIAFSSDFNKPYLCSPVSLDLKQSHTFLEIQPKLYF